MNKTMISIFLNIILIGGIVYFFVTENNTIEKHTDTNEKQINEKNETKRIESDSIENLITMDDINVMQEIGVLVSFENDKEAYKIPSDMTPDRLLEANYLSFNSVPLYVLPNWLSKMHNLLWLDLAGTKVTSEELQKLQGLKKLKFLNVSGQEHIKAEEINLPSLLIGRDLEKIKFSFDNEKKSHLTSLDITQKRLLEAKHINFNGTKLLQLPNWFSQMDNLVRLDLSNTDLVLNKITNKLSSIKHLRILDLSHNPLFTGYSSWYLEGILGIEHSKKSNHLLLTELYLQNTGGKDDNYISNGETHYYSNYDGIGKLSTLVKLNLSNNYISNLKSLHLEELSNLKNLNLLKNNLGYEFNTLHLPKDSLVQLNLSFNDISTFLFNGDFPQLELLDISNNKRQLSFDAKYGGAFILNKIKQVKVNNDVRLPNGLWKKLTKDILPEIIAYGKMPTIIIDGLEYQNNLVINDINGTEWRMPTKEEVDKLKIANPLRNSRGKEFNVRKEFVENLPDDFTWFNFDGFKREEGGGLFSRMRRMKEHYVIRYVRELKVPWLSIEPDICKKNGGKIELTTLCYANWNSAVKICSEMGGKIFTLNMLNEKKQLSTSYWSSRTDINDIHFVRCVKKSQKNDKTKRAKK